ncbi:hypothetical protein CHLRE_09g400600v5 [Chlamydomonas reinhardtii]|uniref:Uncharacterized protein n=1 Tax=Chlamydomonas reinhardtii TaxID=3055 RepID=A0A2K3DCU1_CHLRE|nr:uncharacterized protein CHLRE_09g400600v5 [Chlamydomonas reinhardtii]PNW78354.1 hypothetical protein CHLRE_09g400600v5 [Chlamydomonas reinhardtii]
MTVLWGLLLVALLAVVSVPVQASSVWKPHILCAGNTCDASGMCFSASAAKWMWDSCPSAGWQMLGKANVTDDSACELSSSCSWSRSCPEDNVYVSASCGDCWGCVETAAGSLQQQQIGMSVVGRAYVKCCPKRLRVNCAEMLPCVFEPTAESLVAHVDIGGAAQRRRSAAACATPDSFLGDLLASNMSADPVFRGAVNMFPPLGAVMTTMPSVFTWYAARWDAGIRPVVSAMLCGKNGAANSIASALASLFTRPPATADRAISVLRRLLVPVAQSALDTTPGSVLFDLINNDLGFATKNVNAYLTRDNVQLATNFIQAFTSSTDEDTLSLLVEAADLAGGAVGADYDYGSVLGYVANNPFGIVGVLVGLGAELLSVDSRVTAMLTMTAGEKDMFQKMQANLAQLKPAIKGMIQVLERYPDYQVALAAPSLKDVVTPTTQTPSTVPDAANACAASKDGADTFLTSKLATDSTFLSSLATLPYIGNMFQTIPAVVDWWVGAYDKTVGVVMRLALCNTKVADIATKDMDLALAALKDLALPVVKRFLVTNSGIILSQALQKNFGFNTSDIGPDYLTKQVVSDVVQFLKDNEADLDYGLAYVPGVVGYGLLTLMGLDDRFTIPDLISDALIAMYAMAEVPVQVLGGGSSSSSASGRRMIADTTSPLAAVLTLSTDQKQAFNTFSTSVLQVQAQTTKVLSTVGVSTSAPLPGAAPIPTLAPGAGVKSDGGSAAGLAAHAGLLLGCLAALAFQKFEGFV